MAVGSDRKLERLLNLVTALLDTERPLTRDEIFDRLDEHYIGDPETKRRAFERDKEVLREMGIPLDTVERHQSGLVEAAYRIRPEAYELPDPGLTAEELEALRLAVATVEIAPGSATEALWKLGDGTLDRLEAPPIAAALPDDPRVATLFGAVVARRRVRFSYKATAREVDPWKLSCGRGRWYLRGFDHSRGADRLYRLDRIDGDVDAVGDARSFERPDGDRHAAPPAPWLLGDEVEVEATLLVDADHAGWVAKAHDLEPSETRADGSAVFTVPVANRPAFRSFVLGLLDRAEVLGPPDVRADLVAWLRALRPAAR